MTASDETDEARNVNAGGIHAEEAPQNLQAEWDMYIFRALTAGGGGFRPAEGRATVFATTTDSAVGSPPFEICFLPSERGPLSGAAL